MIPQESPSRSCDRASACVIIPVYNHARTVGAVVRGVLAYASTVLVCDDGSTDRSGEIAEAEGAVVLRVPKNQGKGAALKRLLDEASRRGFRRAISLDADGQHLPSDIPAMVEASVREAGALVIGSRDLVAAGAPPSSEFGRKFSNFWIWFETGATLEDSQSGFRAYPLPESAQLHCRRPRYEFETEIILRAAWAGLALRSIPIGVLYPRDRVTHLRLWIDNTRIVFLNTLACLSMPLPLPLGPRLRRLPHRPGASLFALRRWAWLGGEGPLWRGSAAALGTASFLFWGGAGETVLQALLGAVLGLGALPTLVTSLGVRELIESGWRLETAAGALLGAAVAWGWVEHLLRPPPRVLSRWTGRSRGGVFGHWFFFQVTRWLGVAPAYAALYPIALYFLFAAGEARRASGQFLDRAVGPKQGARRWLRSYRHLLCFARTLVDRAVLATRGPGALSCETQGLEHIREAAAQGHGAILLTAHMGNWEVAAAMLDAKAAPNMAVVAFHGEGEKLAQYLAKSRGPSPRVIKAGQELLGSLEMIRALRGNTVLAIQGDRPVDRHWIRMPFLGREAPFPIGPFMMAAVSGAPLIPTFSIQTGRARYRFLAAPAMRLRFERGRSRDAQLREWVERYVQQLEALAREFPFQWFNFYDFWDAEPA